MGVGPPFVRPNLGRFSYAQQVLAQNYANDLANMQRFNFKGSIPTHTTAPQGHRKRAQKCDNCGAPLSANRCDYCGTNYI